METPNFVVDVHNRLWQYDDWIRKYRCLTTPALEVQELTWLISYFGPINELTQGKEVLPPFKPIAYGTWVEFDRDILVPKVAGLVHDYDADKLFYRVIINVPLNSVKEAE